MTRPLRVLIVRVGAMGDVLHGMPAVAGLRAAMPECFIGWAVEDHLVPLLRDAEGAMPLVDKVHVVRTKDWRHKPRSRETAEGILALRRELRAEGYDVCVDLQGALKAAVVSWMSGSRRVVGSATPKEWPSQWFYDQKVRLPQINVIHQACELVGAAVGRWIPTDEALLPLAFEKESGVRPHPFELPLDAESERWVEGLGLTSGYAMLSPTAGWGGKEWGVERFGALTAGLRAAGVPVVVNAVAGRDAAAAEAVAAQGATVVPSTLAQMIALVRRAGIMIGGDSGPVHMAAALGRPVVMLFGATDPARNGPDFVGARARVIRHPSSVTDYRHHQHTDEGLKQIRVEEVLAAALAMLGETRQA